ncbi:TrmH family RNA methyltransferase [Gramella jeungdoensis]|uniref:TrmH family RNA methyltransferase n=1 Tax=Gramella jeungdoensis TaxID=708091 RepID=A0ABT0Z4I9_9FLAO|nr:TrmH family RNA methyltransferase [Gramella jeungdoensis]MCM8570057.1 TrmH family RNA methyltransferase [Gramella jeungdoensis]
MSEQLSHNETGFQKKCFPIILLLDNVTGEANIGSLFRMADAFGIEKIIFSGTRPNLNSNRLKRTARNTHNTVDFEFVENPLPQIESLKKENYRTISLEITSGSQPIQNFREKISDKIILVAGNERHGISHEILKICDLSFHIEMFGENSSMNVAQSVGIAFYEITKTLNKFHKK